MSIEASTAEEPSTTVPSVAIFSPGRTRKRSPTFNSAIETVCSCPPGCSTVTSFAPSSSSAFRAAPALRLERASKYRPARMNAVTPAAASRYRFPEPSPRAIVSSKGCFIPGVPAVPRNRAHRDQPKAAVVPTEISVSMVAAPCRALVNAALWKGHPAYVTTGAANVRDSHCQYANCSAGIIAIATTGTASSTAVTNRSRRERSSSGSSSPGADGSGGAGSRAEYPVFSTVAIRSWTETPAAWVTLAFSVA